MIKMGKILEMVQTGSGVYELLDRMDLVYIASGCEDAPQLKGVKLIEKHTLESRKVISDKPDVDLEFLIDGKLIKGAEKVRQLFNKNEGNTKLSNLRIYGAVFVQNHENRMFPIPLFSIGDPKTNCEPSLNVIIYDGLWPSKIEDGFLYLIPGQKNIIKDEEGFIYFIPTSETKIDQHDFIQSLIFNQPLRFNPSKQLIFVRSPNGKFKFEEALCHAKFNEGDSAKAYALIYEDLNKLKQNIRWGRRGL